MIYLPYPNLQESINYLNIERQHIQFGWTILEDMAWEGGPIFQAYWKYHTYFLCEYALLGLQKLFTYKLNPNSCWFAYTFQKRNLIQENIKIFKQKQKKVRDTGPPEWVGNEEIHQSHRLALKDSNIKPIVPKVNFTERLVRIQSPKVSLP
jgi:hypothetical protein